MAKLKKILFILACAFFIVQLSSCSSVNHSNFSKKKYTNYRSQRTQKLKHNAVTAQSNIETETDFSEAAETDDLSKTLKTVESIRSSDEQEMDVAVPSTGPSNKEKETLTQLESIKETNTDAQLNDSDLTNENEAHESTERAGNRSNFEKFSKEKQVQRLIEFTALFNTTAVIMIIAAVAGLFAIFSWPFLIPGGTALVIGWVLSMIATTKVKRICVMDQSKKFQRKHAWFMLVKIIGIVGISITLIGGLLLLLLWLLRVY